MATKGSLSASGLEQYPGVVVWAFIILALCALQFVLENLNTYGALVKITDLLDIFILYDKDLTIFFGLHCVLHVLACLITEKALASGKVSKPLGMTLHFGILTTLILTPMVVTHYNNFSIVSTHGMFASVGLLELKLWSYVQVNLWYRSAKQNYGAVLDYPNNVTFGNMLYFLYAPSICYHISYPKNTRIRKTFLSKKLLEIFFLVLLCHYIYYQHLVPSAKSLLVPFTHLDLFPLLEGLPKLAIITNLLWLCCFYIQFHSFLNVLSEVLRFAERNFYDDWWNATNLEAFWRKWNVPVHKWVVRHFYIPLIDMGYSKSTANTLTWFLSAFFHECMISFPLKTYRIWVFLSMMGQKPLARVTKYVEKNIGPRWSNIMVWGTLVIGQPLCLLTYFRDFVLEYHGEEMLQDIARMR